MAKKKYQEAEHNKQIYLEKLARIDQELDIEEVLERVEKNKQEIKGYFLQEQEKLERQRDGLDIEYQSLMNQLEVQNKEQEDLIKMKHQLDIKHSNNEALINANKKEMQKIEKAILSQPNQEKVEEQLQVWIDKQNALDEETTTLTDQNKSLEIEKEDRKKKAETEQIQLQEMYALQSSLSTRIEQFEAEHQQVKEKLSAIKIQWANLDSVYLKQDSIKHQLLETISRFEKEREELLQKERLSYRFVDDYSNQDIFYADPFLSQQIEHWRNQFSFLETGVRYFQLHGQGNEEQFQSNPLWPTTLITTTKEKGKLIEKIKQISKQIQFPVYVLTTDDARQMLSSDDQKETWISPLHWQKNVNQHSFETWKQAVHEQASEAKKIEPKKKKKRKSGKT